PPEKFVAAAGSGAPMSSMTINVSGAAATRNTVEEAEPLAVVFDLSDVSVRYGANVAVEGVSMEISARRITGLIGPSGCGKSTLLRCLNRMNDLVAGAKVGGKLTYHGQDLYASSVD